MKMHNVGGHNDGEHNSGQRLVQPIYGVRTRR
jgi:hypothetical protein